ncbi:MAG: DUF5615 family PIN-like protein [Elusimicrobiota bacterium]
MRILFDECVPKRLRRLLPDYDVKTVPEANWAGIKNGELLKKAKDNFDVFITVDRNLSFQQNPSSVVIPIVVIHSYSNKLRDLEPLIPQLVQVLQAKLTLQVYHVGI